MMYKIVWIFLLCGGFNRPAESQGDFPTTSSWMAEFTDITDVTSQYLNGTDEWVEEELSIDDIDWGTGASCALKVYVTYRHLFDEVTNEVVTCVCFDYCEDTSSKEKTKILKKLTRKFAREDSEDDIPIMVSYISVMVTGVVGNALVLVTVIWIFKAASVTNMFICSLAVADFIVVSVCIPFRMIDYVGDGIWDLGEETCKFFVYLYFTSFMFSVFVLTAMSLERYMVICHPMKAASRSTPGRARKIILVTLVAALVFASPSAVTSGLDGFDCSTASADMKSQWRGPLYIYLTVAVFAVPSCVMGFAYISTGLALWKSVKAANAMKGGNEKAKEKSADLKGRIQVIRMLIMVWIMFVFAWGPYLIFNSIVSYARYIDLETSGGDDTILVQTFNLLTMANSAVNPLLYAFMSRQFRRGFMKVFLCVPFVKRRYAAEPSSAATGVSHVRSSTVASIATTSHNVKSVNPST